MRNTLAGLWMAGLAAAGGAAPAAADQPVVVELYTSQGCSSCPPADALLAELAERDDVIPLALHVDYWDYIGWKDIFANPAHTERQKAYARAAGARTIYTPQMIVGGRDHVVGYKPMRLAELIETHGDRTPAVRVDLTRQGDTLSIRAEAAAALPQAAVIQVLRYAPGRDVAIHRGENAGRTLTYSNIVTELRRVGTWDGAAPLSLEAPVPGTDPVVVLIQAPGHGRILGAARLR